MSERLPWFPCNPTKLLGALAGMKPTEGYTYVIALLRIYESGGACRDSVEALAMRTKYNRRVVSGALETLIRDGRLRRDEDGIHNPVADAVLAETNALREKRKSAGSNGASRRWKKSKENQTPVDSKAIQEPIADHSHLDSHLHESLFPIGKSDVQAKKSRGEKPKTPASESPRSILDAVLSPELAAGVIEHRQKLRKPLTALAAKGLARDFVETGQPDDAARMMIELGWQRIKPEWFFKERDGGGNGFNRQNGGGNRPAEGSSLAAISLAARDRGARENGR